MIEFDEGEDPDLSPSAELWMELCLGDHKAFLKSVIKHRYGHRYSLFFPDILTNDGFYTQQPLRKIVESLKRALLQEDNRLAQ